MAAHRSPILCRAMRILYTCSASLAAVPSETHPRSPCLPETQHRSGQHPHDERGKEGSVSACSFFDFAGLCDRLHLVRVNISTASAISSGAFSNESHRGRSGDSKVGPIHARTHSRGVG